MQNIKPCIGLVASAKEIGVDANIWNYVVLYCNTKMGDGTILQNVIIGEVVVCGRSFVTKDVLYETVVAGSPVRFSRTLEEYGLNVTAFIKSRRNVSN
jgi:hypothetical protein